MTLDYDPFSIEAMENPYPIYQELRKHYPVYSLAQYRGWALSRFEHVWQVLEDRGEAFSVVEGPVFVRELVSHPFDRGVPPAAPERSFATWDPPLHTVIRKTMMPWFRPQAVLALENRIREQAQECLDSLLPPGRFDVVSDYAGPLAALTMSPLLGLPDENCEKLLPLINRYARRQPGRPGFTEEGLAAQREIHQFIQEQVAEQRRANRRRDNDSVMDALFAFETGGRRLDDADIATQLFSLLVGGVETLPKILAGGVLQLCRHPDQRADLARTPRSLAGDAFEEMMRHQGVLQHIGRTALQDIEIGGQRIRRGERLFLLLQSANRDEREFPDAEQFDIHRRPGRTLSLGRGLHHCIGGHLARLEGKVLLEVLIERLPEFSVVEDGVERLPSDFQLGYTAMPVAF